MDIRTPINPPATADGVNCTHCYTPLAAIARLSYGGYDWVHADTGKKRCAHVARAEPRSGWDAGLRIDAAIAAREVSQP